MQSQCPECNRLDRPSESSGSGEVASNAEVEIHRLRQSFYVMAKTSHGEQALNRHTDILPEWVAQIVETPYDQWQETDPRSGNPVAILVGRVHNWNQWIKVVLSGSSPESSKFHTAYSDRRLEEKYGGKPWENLIPIQPQNQ